MGIVLQVYFERADESGGRPPRFSFVETEFQTFSEACEAIDACALIEGKELRVNRTAARDVAEIYLKSAMVFRGDAVQRAILSGLQFDESPTMKEVI